MEKDIFKFSNPNPKQKYHKDGKPYKWNHCDCTTRALAHVENISWIDAFKIQTKIAMENYLSPADHKCDEIVYESLGYRYGTFPRSSKKPTLYQFAKEHKKGRYVCHLNGHDSSVIDGKILDTWDCGEWKVFSYFEKI